MTGQWAVFSTVYRFTVRRSEVILDSNLPTLCVSTPHSTARLSHTFASHTHHQQPNQTPHFNSSTNTNHHHLTLHTSVHHTFNQLPTFNCCHTTVHSSLSHFRPVDYNLSPVL